ncbi:polysialyltransferase family glycosyltransferase [Domibacillus robiginosus]|uniref:polysialyltransferase family glycosyltransferase n=1 Tax=Domibacillus robiginosus TaxID=1071054 RepID=UPI00067C4FE5|nr:polysialyltransferase family glycosyltransferase [Domibacillus robiginosus]
MNIFVCSTLYHVYVSLLICCEKESDKQSIFILTSHDSEMKKSFQSISKKLSSLEQVKSVYIRDRSRLLDNLMIERVKDLFINKKIFKENKVNKKNGNFYLFGWNQYHLYRTNAPFFRIANSVILVEEGASAYLVPPPSKKSLLLKKLYGMNPKFYKDSKVKHILVQLPENYLAGIKRKVNMLELNDMVQQLSEIDRKMVFNIFLEEKVRKQIEYQLMLENNKGAQKIIILTQPLSEDGFENENNKIKYYQEIIDSYSGATIFLKPHPREKTIYNFKNVIILDKFFPSELLSFFSFEFDKAIGICTSAVYQVKAKKQLNLKEDYFSRK